MRPASSRSGIFPRSPSGQIFRRYAFELASAVFTPDSKHLLIGDQIGRLMVWDVAEGRVVETLNEHTGGITTISLRARRPDHGDVQS